MRVTGDFYSRSTPNPRARGPEEVTCRGVHAVPSGWSSVWSHDLRPYYVDQMDTSVSRLGLRGV